MRRRGRRLETTPAPDPAAREETARAADTVAAQVRADHSLLEAAQVGSCRDPQPAPDHGTGTNPRTVAGASVTASLAAAQPPAALVALLADPAIATVSDTGM